MSGASTLGRFGLITWANGVMRHVMLLKLKLLLMLRLLNPLPEVNNFFILLHVILLLFPNR